MAEPEKKVQVARILKALILGATLLAVLVHTFQCVVFSGGRQIPGDLTDARFTNLVLEHLYQSVLGHQTLESPAHFYPEMKTLYYSDAHWGTFPLYLVPRLSGLSMGTSFQAWMMAIQAINVLAFFYLLGALGVSWGLRPFITFFSLAGFHMTWKVGIGHLQVLVLFPFILSIAFLVRFIHRRRLWDLCASLLFLIAEHFGYVYLGYLSFFVWTAVVVAAWAFPPDPSFRKEVVSVLTKHWSKIALTGMVCLIGLAVLYRPYLEFMSTKEIRSLASTRSLSPHLNFWFSAPSDSLFYYWQDLLGAKAHRAESYLFSGWVIWLIGGLSCFLYRRWPGKSNLRLAVLLLLSCLGLAVFFTAIGTESSGWSPYLLLAKVLKPVRAFRAVGRVEFLMIILLGMAAGIVLHEMVRSSSRRWKALGWGLACLLALDVMAVRQTSYSKELARERADRLAQAVLSGGGQAVFAYLPYPPGREPWERIHLDAWHAAILTRRRTVNGYSSNTPQAHAAFVFEPNREQLGLFVKRAGLSMEDILVIEGKPPSGSGDAPLK